MESVWSEFAHDIGAVWERGDFWQPDRVRAPIGPWTVTLDVHQFSAQAAHVACTRLRAPLLDTADIFMFSAARINTFHDADEEPPDGQQIFQSGSSHFDDAFRVTGSNTARLTTLFADGVLPALLSAQTHIGVGVERDEKDGERFLICLVVEVVRDPSRLLALFDIMTEILLRLERPEQ